MLYRTLVLILWVSLAGAQNNKDEDKKRPSWSQGIPERQSTPDMGRPQFDPADSAIEIETSAVAEGVNDFKLDVITPEITPPATLPDLPEPVIRPASADVAVTAAVSAVEAASNDLYDWHIEQQQPVLVPADTLQILDRVMMKISINANGEVVAVEAAQDDLPQDLFNRARKSINQWRFAAPKYQGVEVAILSRVFEINLTDSD